VLILTRRPGEAIAIGDEIVLEVVAINGQQIKLGIEAPSEVRVLREELLAQQERD
jgi:carbon storage regulator